MARKNDLRQTYCIMCTKPIPRDRRKDAVTCSKDCAVARRNHQRSLQDEIYCRYCSKPSTPEQRQSYMRWKKMDKQNRATSAAVQKQWSPEQRVSFLAWKRRWEDKHADASQ